MHDRLLRSKACVSFHLLVFFLLWVAHTGRLDLRSKMVPLTNCLNSGESLPVPLLELIWMWWLLANFWLAHLFKEGFHSKFSFRILFPQVVTVQMLWWLLEIEKQKSFFQIYEKKQCQGYKEEFQPTRHHREICRRTNSGGSEETSSLSVPPSYICMPALYISYSAFSLCQVQAEKSALAHLSLDRSAIKDKKDPDSR